MLRLSYAMVNRNRSARLPERQAGESSEPTAVLRPIHDRMPVILPPGAYAMWLDPAMRDVEPVQALLTPYPADAMVAYPVSTQVNSPAYDAPDLVGPLASGSRSRFLSRQRKRPRPSVEF